MSILTVAEYRGYHTTTIQDAPLQQLLDAAEADITNVRGAIGARTERRRGGLRLVTTSRVADRVSAVSEISGGVATVLASDDWMLLPDGSHIARLDTGTNPADRWADWVLVTYTPPDDTKERKRVQVLLVKLDLAYSGYGAMSTTSESRSTVGKYQEERRAILDSFSLPGIVR